MRRNCKHYITSVDYAQAAENGISKRLLRDRIWGRGWKKKRAKTEPPNREEIIWYKIAEENGISRSIYYKRVKLGWEKKEAATTPKEKIWVEIARENGIKNGTFYSRISRGWDEEKAATIPTLEKGRPRKEK